MTTSSMRTAGLVVAAALLLTSCGSDGAAGDTSGNDTAESTPLAAQIFPDDFKGVCSGATESRAADYAASETHKVVYLETYEDGLVDQSSSLPSDWTVQFDANSDAYAAVDVVACGIRSDEELAQKCEGYKDEETGTNGSVNWYTGTYEVSAYEAKTGKALGSTTIEADDDECPMFASFDEGDDEIDMYDSPAEEEVTKFLKAFVQP